MAHQTAGDAAATGIRVLDRAVVLGKLAIS